MGMTRNLINLKNPGSILYNAPFVLEYSSLIMTHNGKFNHPIL